VARLATSQGWLQSSGDTPERVKFMQRTKRLTRLAVAGCFVAALAWAQFPTSKTAVMQEAAKRLDTIAKKLKLSPDQVAKIKPLLTQQIEQTAAAREKFAAGDRSEASKQETLNSIRQSRAEASGEVRNTLSPDQLRQWDDMVKGWKEDVNLKKLASR
jgi:hypothetical protein